MEHFDFIFLKLHLNHFVRFFQTFIVVVGGSVADPIHLDSNPE